MENIIDGIVFYTICVPLLLCILISSLSHYFFKFRPMPEDFKAFLLELSFPFNMVNAIELRKLIDVLKATEKSGIRVVSAIPMGLVFFAYGLKAIKSLVDYGISFAIIDLIWLSVFAVSYFYSLRFGKKLETLASTDKQKR